MLLFTFNLGAYSANAMVTWYHKISRYGYAMTIPGIDYGLYLDDYDMFIIILNYVMFMSHMVYSRLVS